MGGPGGRPAVARRGEDGAGSRLDRKPDQLHQHPERTAAPGALGLLPKNNMVFS